MIDKDVFLAKNSLSVIKVLQSTKNNTTELVCDNNRKKYVLKIFHKNTKASRIERKFIQRVQGKQFKSLVLPELVSYGNDFMLVTFVDREYFTRETIATYKWNKSDLDRFHTGLSEFQSTSICPGWFPVKSIMMGIAYPAIHIIKVIPKCIRYRIIQLNSLGKLASLAILYLFIRPTFRNVTTHYDLTTYNYAFSGEERMSLIDFDLAYYLGDPLYDVAYFATIPPVRLYDWTFQKHIISRQLEEHGKSWKQLARLRLILLGACINRCIYFRKDQEKRKIYMDNINVLLDKNKYNNFIMQCLNE